MQQPIQTLTETQYSRFLFFFKNLNHVNDNDTNPEDAFTTLFLNPHFDVVSCRITKCVKANHIRISKDENGFIYYEIYMSDFTRRMFDFINDFQILNSKGDVQCHFLHSGLPEKYQMDKTDIINSFVIGNKNIPFGLRFTFKGEPYPIEYSYAGYIFNHNAKNIFMQNFGNNIFLRM